MKYREAKKLLEKAGYELIRHGTGSHRIFQKGNERIVLSENGELSEGIAGKVRSVLNKSVLIKK